MRLTMGGEPTFISLDDARRRRMDHQRFRAPTSAGWPSTCCSGLRDRFAPGALLHFGQGKWYPGEPLPRWALGCYWRKDGVPIWENQSLFAEDGKDYGYDATDARKFLEALRAASQVSFSFTITGLRRHLLLPVEGAAAARQRRSARLQTRRIPSSARAWPEFSNRPAEQTDRAMFFPCARIPTRSGTPRWTSQPWFPLRRTHVSGPWRFAYGLSSAARIAALDQAGRRRMRFRSRSFPAPRQAADRGRSAGSILFSVPAACRLSRYPTLDKAQTGETRGGRSRAPWVSRPALCVQAREGKLYIFMPPVEYLADYLDLVAAIEDTAAHLAMPVVIEGYTPPYDPRISRPQSDSRSRRDRSQYPARRHLGRTGGKHHRRSTSWRARPAWARRSSCSMGGTPAPAAAITWSSAAPPPEDSPFLRRPDLLRSMVGLLAEPSVAFLSVLRDCSSAPPASIRAWMKRASNRSTNWRSPSVRCPTRVRAGHIPPWLVDRIFRNLLIDVTGNTHRAEFCIDKLYPPDGAGSRLGLVELRAFEMPPHARMSLTQQLLVRALIAHFWATPYRQKLIPWGTSAARPLHAAAFRRSCDLEDVLRELQRRGLPVSQRLVRSALRVSLSAHRLGDRARHSLELRHALEPWNVLGEEASGGGTARNVDSSVERMQVKVSGHGRSRASPCSATAAACRCIHRHGGRIRRRRALSRLAAAVLPASQHPGSQPAGL